MAQTIQALHDAIMQSPQAAQAKRLLQRLCGGTTSRWEAQRVLYFGKHLALVAWDFGSKDVVVIESPKRASAVEHAALRHFGLVSLPKRLSPSDLGALVCRCGEADAAWPRVTAAFAAAARKDAEAQEREAALKEEVERWRSAGQEVVGLFDPSNPAVSTGLLCFMARNLKEMNSRFMAERDAAVKRAEEAERSADILQNAHRGTLAASVRASKEAEEAKSRLALAERAAEAAITDALGVLVTLAQRDGTLYHDAFQALTRTAPGVLTGTTGGRKVTINVTVE